MIENEQQEKAIERVEKAARAIAAGQMVIMTDDEDRENEGDLVFAASDACPEKINFMAKEARGLICLSLKPERIATLQLPLMKDQNKDGTPYETAFTVSNEAKTGVSTGISARDRARTIQVAVDERSGPDDLVVPGHVFPLRAKKGGVLERAGHTEGSIDLVRLAGKPPAGVICEIMNDDGSMARIPELEKFAEKHCLPIVTIADLITYRLSKESLISEIGRRPFSTSQGTFDSVWFQSKLDQSTHFALVKGVENSGENCVDVRVHKQRLLGDLFGSTNLKGKSHCPNKLLRYGISLLKERESACFVYLSRKLEALDINTIDDENTEANDPRMYGLGAQILLKLGIKSMRVHLSSERALKGLAGFGLKIEDTEIIK